MSVNYAGVLWNPQKKTYDKLIAGLALLYLLVFAGAQLVFQPDISPETLIIRGTSTLAMLLLHIILCIGPLCRINPQFLPLLYNRRHLGVTMFLLALIHGVFSIIQFHTLGDQVAFISLFTANTHYDSILRFPFQVLGFFALIILFLMAATSHDFWLKNLGLKAWKGLHMLVYVAYFLLVMHVLLGVLQQERSPVLFGLVAAGALLLIGLHLMAGFKERKIDAALQSLEKNGFVAVCFLEEIKENRAKIFTLGEERIAVFKYENKLSAVANVCKHQGGPLGEGKIVDGCITCPWHGYQYQPADGCSPPPFTEKVSTYAVVLEGDRVWVNPTPHPEGTALPPAEIHHS